LGERERKRKILKIKIFFIIDNLILLGTPLFFLCFRFIRNYMSKFFYGKNFITSFTMKKFAYREAVSRNNKKLNKEMSIIILSQ